MKKHKYWVPAYLLPRFKEVDKNIELLDDGRLKNFITGRIYDRRDVLKALKLPKNSKISFSSKETAQFISELQDITNLIIYLKMYVDIGAYQLLEEKLDLLLNMVASTASKMEESLHGIEFYQKQKISET